MSSTTSISIDKLARLIGTPRCPVLIDVQTNEDFAADPRLIPGAIRRPWSQASEWAKEFRGQSAIVICQKGLKISQGVAAWLRHEGVPADSLDGGALAWARCGVNRAALHRGRRTRQRPRPPRAIRRVRPSPSAGPGRVARCRRRGVPRDRLEAPRGV